MEEEEEEKDEGEGGEGGRRIVRKRGEEEKEKGRRKRRGEGEKDEEKEDQEKEECLVVHISIARVEEAPEYITEAAAQEEFVGKKCYLVIFSPLVKIVAIFDSTMQGNSDLNYSGNH